MKWIDLWKQCLVILCVAIISGCSTLRFIPAPPSTYKANYTLEDYNNDLSIYKPMGTSVNVRTYYRNKIVYLTKMEIDKNYAAFKNSFFGERAATETLLDIAQIGLTSAATLAAGETIKTVLAAVATGVSGSRLSFNKNFFKEKSPDLLISRMDAIRIEKWSQLHLQLMNSTDDTYSLYEAEGDLFAYYQAGSLQAAFQNIIAESGATQKEAEDAIRKQIEKKYGGSIGGPDAPEDQLKDIAKLYKELYDLTDSVRENQAKKVIDKFKELQPAIPINPDVPNAKNWDNVIYLYSLARKNYPVLRTALIQALQYAKGN